MKNRFKRLLSIILLMLMVASSFSSCKKNYVYKYDKYCITINEYTYWVSSYKRNILSYYNMLDDSESFWNNYYNDNQTNREFYEESINKTIMKYLISEKLFDDYGLQLSQEEIDEINNKIQDNIDSYGSRQNLNQKLSEYGINVDTLKNIYTFESKYECLYDYLSSENGELYPTEDQVNDYYVQNYSLINYIVLYKEKLSYDNSGNIKYDSDGIIMSEKLNSEELNDLLDKKNEIIDKLENNEDIFDLISEYSDYNYLDKYPNGLFVSSNEISTYGTDFVKNCSELSENNFAELELDTCIYIIYKQELPSLDLLDDTDLNQLTYLINNTSEKLFDDKLNDLINMVYKDDNILNSFDFDTIKIIDDDNL